MFERILYTLFDNPILLLILGGYLLSLLGNVFTKAAKRAEQQRRLQQQRQDETSLPPAARQQQPEARPLQPRSEPARRTPARPAASSRRGSGDRSPEEIAAEIRRIMGMGEGPPEVVVREEPEPPPPTPPRAPQPSAAKPVGGDRGWASFAGSQVGRTVLGAGIGSSFTGTGGVGVHIPGTGGLGSLGGRVRGERKERARKRKAGRLVDLSHPARGIVMMEILGPPKALRSEL